MTIARGAAAGALVIVVAIVAIVLLSGSGTTSYALLFDNAGQIVKGDNVTVGGRRIGNVDAISLTNDNQAKITISVQEPYAPLHQGTTATIRLQSLSGVANRFIQLTPGPNNGPKLRAGATLGTEQTTSVVDLDQLFNTFDARTRKGLQDVIQGSATQYQGKTAQVNEAARQFNPALSTTSQVMRELTRDTQTLTDALVSGGQVMSAIAQRRDSLSALVGNLSTTMGAIGSQNQSLGQALQVLPDTLRQANSTFVDLRSTLDDMTPLVDASKTATKRLAPFFSALRPLIDEATPTFQQLSAIVSTPGANNDLTDILRQTPQLATAVSRTSRSGIAALRKGQPVIDYARPYAPDLVGWFRDFGEAGANYDANGHYVRVMPLSGAFQFQQNADGSSVLNPVTPNQRLSQLDTGNVRRCPGSASQPRPDGSNPYLPAGFDCAAKELVPGP
jgi:phospholipid/cholesterol/gamma-HCH transport system substrate-binding protein